MPPRRERDLVAPDLGVLDQDPAIEPPSALARLADERVLHGLLRTLPGSARAAADRRVAGAVAMLPPEGSPRELVGQGPLGQLGVASAAGARGRVGPRGVAEPRHRRALRALGRVLPAIALVVVALFLARFATESPRAVAEPLDPIEEVVRHHVKAGEKAGPRRYSLLIERDTPRGLAAMRGVIDLAPSGARKPDGTQLRGNRFKVRLGPPNRPPLQAFGFDGAEFWHAPAEGPVRVGPDKSIIDERSEFRGLVPWLTVERALQMLPAKASDGLGEPEKGADPEARRERGRRLPPIYQLETTDLEGGLRRYALRRDPELALRRPLLSLRPSEVVFEARTSDNVVVRLDAYWQDDAQGQTVHPGRVKHLRFELMADQVPPPGWEWFSHRSLGTEGREIERVPARTGR